MSRTPKHTPESRAKNATKDIQEVTGLDFTHLGDINRILIDHFTDAMPPRTRKPKTTTDTSAD